MGKQPPTSEFTVSRPFRIHQASTVKERDSLRKMKITEARRAGFRLFFFHRKLGEVMFWEVTFQFEDVSLEKHGWFTKEILQKLQGGLVFQVLCLVFNFWECGMDKFENG